MNTDYGTSFANLFGSPEVLTAPWLFNRMVTGPGPGPDPGRASLCRG